MFHRVLPEEDAAGFYNPYLAITPRSFEDFLAFLSKHFQVQPLAELVPRLHVPNSLGPRCCALTFDDGWEDNHRVAWPILRKFGMPATIFVTAGLTGTSGLLPEDRLWRYWQEARTEGSLPAFDGILRTYRGAQPAATDDGFSAYRTILKQLPGHQRLELFADLAARFGELATPNSSAFMTWDQLKELSGNGITLGSHTVTHPSLAYEEDSVIREELGVSKLALEQHLGKKVDSLAYPTGIFDERVTREAAAAGYTIAVTTESRAVGADAKPLLLPRVAIDSGVVNDATGRFSAARTRLHILRAGGRS
jgi:peptidoglycan/xylan/chitin deacetylase (PgdA/CDA1 family)